MSQVTKKHTYVVAMFISAIVISLYDLGSEEVHVESVYY